VNQTAGTIPHLVFPMRKNRQFKDVVEILLYGHFLAVRVPDPIGF
jgi:hypothetical protein